MWKAVKIMEHSVRDFRKDDLHLKVKVLWRNGERAWVRMEALRMQHPFLLIQYAVQNKLQHQLEWQWTKEYAINDPTLLEITLALKAARNETKFKFGVEVPHSVRHAIQLDAVNGDTMWQQAMETELKQINEYETFRELGDEPIPPGFKKIPYQMIFDVKFDLRRKARLVAGGHMTDPPKDDIYSGVVGMEAIRTGFLLATLNNLQVCAADIGNAFLYGKTREQVYIVAGPEFGENKGKPLIIDKGLYGLKSSSARFMNTLPRN